MESLMPKLIEDDAKDIVIDKTIEKIQRNIKYLIFNKSSPFL
jgi:hypothetical protein